MSVTAGETRFMFGSGAGPRTACGMRCCNRWSTSCSPKTGSGRRRKARGAEREDCANAFAQSCGGFTNKVAKSFWARSDNQGRPLGLILTGSVAPDYAVADALMIIPVTTPKALQADKGYDGGAFHQNLVMHGILPIIPPFGPQSART